LEQSADSYSWSQVSIAIVYCRCLAPPELTTSSHGFFKTINENYGIDPEGPAPVDNDDGEGIVIPQTPLKFSSADLSTLNQQVDPLGSTNNYGIDLYEQTLRLIITFTPLYIHPTSIVIICYHSLGRKKIKIQRSQSQTKVNNTKKLKVIQKST